MADVEACYLWPTDNSAYGTRYCRETEALAYIKVDVSYVPRLVVATLV